MNVTQILVTFSSSASIAFGVWHFFVPRAWKWYNYIHPSAAELVTAVRAVNVFFSLSLVLFGVMNLLFIFGGRANRYAVVVLLAATCILWLTRVVMQAVYPQGSLYPGLQYGILAAFLLVWLAYTAALVLEVLRVPAAMQ